MKTKRQKTIFLDIDGTILYHYNETNLKQITCDVLLEGTLEKIKEWDAKGYNIILTTGRKESCRKVTEKTLTKLGIVWDQMVMGIGGGDRILINDRKLNNKDDTVFAINLNRNEGIKNVKI